MGWLIEGNEAIAATQQVKTGDDYIVGRTTMVFWENVKIAMMLLGGLFTGLGLFDVTRILLKYKI